MPTRHVAIMSNGVTWQRWSNMDLRSSTKLNAPATLSIDFYLLFHLLNYRPLGLSPWIQPHSFFIIIFFSSTFSFVASSTFSYQPNDVTVVSSKAATESTAPTCLSPLATWLIFILFLYVYIYLYTFICLHMYVYICLYIFRKASDWSKPSIGGWRDLFLHFSFRYPIIKSGALRSRVPWLIWRSSQLIELTRIIPIDTSFKKLTTDGLYKLRFKPDLIVEFQVELSCGIWNENDFNRLGDDLFVLVIIMFILLFLFVIFVLF